jgi:glycosyltransferase involved in cell wall biosynthesis
MNILFLTYQGDIAGSTNSISYLAKSLAERGHNVYVGCRKESLLYSLLSNTKVKLIEMKFKSKLDFENMKHIRNIVKEYKIDIINSQSSKDRYTANLAKFFYRLPVKVVHTRRQTPKSSGIFIQNWFYNEFTDLIVAVSDEVKAELVKSGIKESKVEVIYNGTPDYKYDIINPEKEKILKKKYSYQDNDIIIGSISRKKEQDQIIKALGKLPENYKLLLIGIHEHEFQEYNDLINSMNLKDRIISLGMIPGEETLNHYQILDVDVLASNMEGLSQSLLEAMYLGVPVTATKAAGNISLIKDGVNGLFFNDGDIEKIAENIKKIVEDTELRKKLIEGGKKTAQIDFSINRVIKNYENVFEKLISK